MNMASRDRRDKITVPCPETGHHARRRSYLENAFFTPGGA